MLVISNQPHASSSSNLEITHLLLPELYSTRSNYYIKPKVITLANHKCTHIEWIINSIKLPIFIYTPWRERGTVRVICLVQEKTKSLGQDLNPDSLIQSLAHLDDCNYLHNNLDLVHKNLFLPLLLVMCLEPKNIQPCQFNLSLMLTTLKRTNRFYWGGGTVGVVVLFAWPSNCQEKICRFHETCSRQLSYTKEYLKIRIHILYNYNFGTQFHNTVKLF